MIRLILKATSSRAHLVKKQITNKAGRKQTVWVNVHKESGRRKKNGDESGNNKPIARYKKLLDILSRDQLINLSGEDKDYWADHTDNEIRGELWDRFDNLSPAEAKEEINTLEETYGTNNKELTVDDLSDKEFKKLHKYALDQMEVEDEDDTFFDEEEYNRIIENPKNIAKFKK